jgi:hypothetical protein
MLHDINRKLEKNNKILTKSMIEKHRKKVEINNQEQV